MRYLLDTCVLSEFLKQSPNSDVMKWLTDQPEASQYLSILSIGEMRKGISKLVKSKRKTQFNEWLDSITIRYDRRLYGLGLDTLNIWGELMAVLEANGRPIPVIDSLFAATALEHNLTIVTRNEKDFIPTKAKVLNIWK